MDPRIDLMLAQLRNSGDVNGLVQQGLIHYRAETRESSYNREKINEYHLAYQYMQAAIAIAPNCTVALHVLAQIAKKGYKVKHNTDQAHEYAQLAFKHGDAEAREIIISLGYKPHSEIPGFQEIEINSAEDFYQLGKTLYANDIAAAITCFEMAAKNNHALALNEIGLYFSSQYPGQNRINDNEKAEICFQRALDQEESADFYFNLGCLQDRMYYIEYRIKYRMEAKKNLAIALSLGNVNAFYASARIYTSIEEQFDHYEAAILYGNTKDITNFNNHYYYYSNSYQGGQLFAIVEACLKLGDRDSARKIIQYRRYEDYSAAEKAFTKNYLSGIEQCINENYAKALDHFSIAQEKATSLPHRAKAAIKIARIKLFKLENCETEALQAYQTAYALASELLAMRKCILMELENYLEKDTDNIKVIKLLAELYMAEANKYFQLEYYKIADNYFAKAVEYSTRISDQPKDQHLNLVFSYAIMLAKIKEKEQKAFDLFVTLASNPQNYLPAKIKVAVILLNGQLGQAANVIEGLKKLAEILLQLSINRTGINLRNSIIHELIHFQNDNLGYIKETNEIFFQILVADSAQSKSKEIELVCATLLKMGNPAQLPLAEETLENMLNQKINIVLSKESLQDLASVYENNDLYEQAEIVSFLAIHTSQKNANGLRRNFVNMFKTDEHTQSILRGFLLEYLNTYTTDNEPAIAIKILLCSLQKEINKGVPNIIGNKANTNPTLVAIAAKIDSTIKQMLKDKLEITSDMAEKIYRKMQENAKKCLSEENRIEVKEKSIFGASTVRTLFTTANGNNKPVDLSQSAAYEAVNNSL